jgi:hypothetical protein
MEGLLQAVRVQVDVTRRLRPQVSNIGLVIQSLQLLTHDGRLWNFLNTSPGTAPLAGNEEVTGEAILQRKVAIGDMGVQVTARVSPSSDASAAAMAL